MPSYALGELRPVVDPTAFVHPDAVLIGDVTVGAGCYVGPVASLRGDFGTIVVEAGANIQDGCVLHSFPEQRVIVEADGHIGHGAVLHGCTIRRGALVGIHAVVMDGAEVAEQAFVAACAFVPAGMKVPPRTLVAGIPARVVRELPEADLARKHDGTLAYQALAARCRATLVEVEPLRAPDPARRRTR